MHGQNVCRMHGGSAPQNRRRGEQVYARQLAEKAARRALDKVGVRSIEDPIGVLHSLTEDAVAMFETLKERVAHWGEDGWTGYDEKGREYMRAEFEAMERAHERAAKFLETWVKLGMDERLVRVQEVQAVALLTALQESTVRTVDEGGRALAVIDMAALAGRLEAA